MEDRRLRLDLHTHCYEATGHSSPDVRTVEKIVDAVVSKGLDGIAITDHVNKDYAYQVKEIVARFFNSEIIIIPGQELNWVGTHFVELYLPNGSKFRFIAHPTQGDLSENCLDMIGVIHGVEMENGNYFIDSEMVKEVAERHGFLLLSNSDAHSLSNIGRHYNEVSFEQLYTQIDLKL